MGVDFIIYGFSQSVTAEDLLAILSAKGIQATSLTLITDRTSGRSFCRARLTVAAEDQDSTAALSGSPLGDRVLGVRLCP